MLKSETAQLTFDRPITQISDLRKNDLMLMAVNVDLNWVGKAGNKPKEGKEPPPK
jgi:hypothetical protein